MLMRLAGHFWLLKERCADLKMDRTGERPLLSVVHSVKLVIMFDVLPDWD